MRIVIDMQGAQSGSKNRGIGRYMMSLTQAIIQNRNEHEVILALNGLFPETIEPIRTAFDGILKQENIRVWYAPGPVCEEESVNDHRREMAELIREAFLASMEPDVIYIGSLFEGHMDDAVTSIGRFDRSTPVAVTLYDLIPLLNPKQYLDPQPRFKQMYMRKLKQLQEAQAFFAISDFSRKEALANLDVSSEKVIALPAAVDARFHPVEADPESIIRLRQRLGVRGDFVLCVGASDERKNLPRLIKAYAALPRALRLKHQLVLSGAIPREHIDALILQAGALGLESTAICFAGHVSDIELLQLYNLCKVYIMPSWHEGFGLPALEAMACGAPVIGANASSLQEVIGLEEALFDPFRVESIQAKLAHALEDSEFRERLKVHGLKQARQFSWDASAHKAIAHFEQLIATRNTTHARKEGREVLIDRLIEGVRSACSGDRESPSLAAIAKAVARSIPREPGNTLFVDVTQLAFIDSGTGIQRVVKNIACELLANPPTGFEVRLVYATTDGLGYRYAGAIKGVDLGAPQELHGKLIDCNAGDVFLGLDLGHHFVCTHQAYLEALRRDGVRIVFVVYDLLPVTLPDCFPVEMWSSHEAWLRTIIHYDGAVCISRAVADELTDWIRKSHVSQGLRPFDITWFHLGTEIRGHMSSAGLPEGVETVLDKISSQTSFLSVGTIEPRKGYGQILGAFEILWKEGINANLVIVGKEGWMVNELIARLRAHEELGKRIFWLEGISDEYLDRVYKASSCTIAASRDEGFGLPLIEAAGYDLPIIARDIPVFREVAGEYAYYFSGTEAEALASAVRRWLQLHEQGKHPKSGGMPRMTWEESAAQLTERILGDEPKSDEAQRMLASYDSVSKQPPPRMS